MLQLSRLSNTGLKSSSLVSDHHYTWPNLPPGNCLAVPIPQIIIIIIIKLIYKAQDRTVPQMC